MLTFCDKNVQPNDERARDTKGLALLPAVLERMPKLGIPARNGGQKAEAKRSPQQPGASEAKAHLCLYEVLSASLAGAQIITGCVLMTKVKMKMEN